MSTINMSTDFLDHNQAEFNSNSFSEDMLRKLEFIFRIADAVPSLGVGINLGFWEFLTVCHILKGKDIMAFSSVPTSR